MVLSVNSSAGRISTRSLSARISAIVKLDRLLGSFSRGTKRIGRTFSTRSRRSVISSPTSTPPSPAIPVTPTPATPSTPVTPGTPSSSPPWLASPKVERAAFYMYLEQLEAQISALDTAVERLEQHLGKVSSGLAVLEGVGRAEIRARLVLAQRGLIADSGLGDAVVREWLKDLDQEVPGEDGDEDDDNEDGGSRVGRSAWEERVQWEKNVFLNSVMSGFEWVRGRLRRVEDGVKAAWGWGGEEELGGKTPRETVVGCRGKMERLRIWIEELRVRYLMSESTGSFERSGGGDGEGSS
ncbi:hypothetical protein EV426DRAFT_687370 [Tirmania nivea]|nr:hypothetical protein EV426DRAFT_687370 [Tirmania nivea]